jgi:putative phosphoribosyl transferase
MTYSRHIIENQPIVIEQADTGPLLGLLSLPSQLDSVIICLWPTQVGGERERQLTQALTRFGFATLMVPLLNDDQQQSDNGGAWNRFNMPMLSRRIAAIIEWIDEHEELAGLPIAIIATDTGASAALIAAARQPHRIHALVLHDSRPDLAGSHLPKVHAPILFACGEKDRSSRLAFQRMVSKLNCSYRSALFADVDHLPQKDESWRLFSELTCNWLSVQSRHPAPPSPFSLNTPILLGSIDQHARVD